MRGDWREVEKVGVKEREEEVVDKGGTGRCL